mgnify:CR=1 FL=1
MRCLRSMSGSRRTRVTTGSVEVEVVRARFETQSRTRRTAHAGERVRSDSSGRTRECSTRTTRPRGSWWPSSARRTWRASRTSTKSATWRSTRNTGRGSRSERSWCSTTSKGRTIRTERRRRRTRPSRRRTRGRRDRRRSRGAPTLANHCTHDGRRRRGAARDRAPRARAPRAPMAATTSSGSASTTTTSSWPPSTSSVAPCAQVDLTVAPPTTRMFPMR